MTALDCSVTTCGYNEDRCCCKNEIDVKGTKADTSDDTCCGSFKSLDCTCHNGVNTPNSNLSISCEACNCVFNENNMCSAEHISIAGSSANTSDQTVCSSFVCK